MWNHIYEWLLMLGRWLHITAAIMWIGTSFFFVWLDRTLVPKKESKREGHIGELWMVHGGGFYQVEKMLLGPNEVPSILHWFKWEAAITWLSGSFLLFWIFYIDMFSTDPEIDKGLFLLDPNRHPDVTYWYAVGIGLITIFASWIIYDLLWQSKLSQKALFCHFITVFMAIGIAYLFCKTLAGRAAYIHMGGVLGTWMIGNVWIRILPNQTKMIAATNAGTPVDPNWGINAKNRSVHNNYFTLAVIFIMMSNHFPSIYGHELNWVFIIIIGLVGAFIRLFFNKVEQVGKSAFTFLIPAALGLFILFAMTMPELEKTSIPNENGTPIKKQNGTNEKNPTKENATKNLKDVDLATAGNLKGLILFQGQPPPPKKLAKKSFPASCKHHHSGEVLDDSVLIRNGKLQNAFIRIQKIEGYKFPRPKKSVKIDQKGCVFSPHILGAQVSQKVQFINSDEELHNVNGFVNGNQIFNIALPFKNQKLKKTFDRALFPIELQCDVHPWMRAYLGIVAHPYFDISNNKGEFSIAGIPPGEYTLEVWHEVFGTQTQKITLSEKQTQTVNFTFKAK